MPSGARRSHGGHGAAMPSSSSAGPTTTAQSGAEDGITTAIEIEVAPENHLRFFRLTKQIRQIFLPNGAFNARLDQDMENPNRFRLYATARSWAAHRATTGCQFKRIGQQVPERLL